MSDRRYGDELGNKIKFTKLNFLLIIKTKK